MNQHKMKSYFTPHVFFILQPSAFICKGVTPFSCGNSSGGRWWLKSIFLLWTLAQQVIPAGQAVAEDEQIFTCHIGLVDLLET